jgi:hypothetical protein
MCTLINICGNKVIATKCFPGYNINNLVSAYGQYIGKTIVGMYTISHSNTIKASKLHCTCFHLLKFLVCEWKRLF